MISLIDFSRVEQEFFLRENLEPAALKHFLRDCQASHLAELEKYIELQSESIDAKKYEQFLQYDNLFHQVFFDKRQIAWEILENMCGHYHWIRLLTIWVQDIVKDRINEHKQLFQAVKQGDAAKALDLLGSHIHKLDAEEALLKRMFPDFFADSGEVPM